MTGGGVSNITWGWGGWGGQHVMGVRESVCGCIIGYNHVRRRVVRCWG